MKDFDHYWKSLARAKQIKPKHVIQRAILMAMNSAINISRRDIVYDILTKAFMPVSRTREIDNGRYAYDTINHHVKAANPFRVCFDIDFGITCLQDDKHNLLLGTKPSNIFENDIERETFHNILRSLDPKTIDRTYCYLLVDRDMSPIQKVVQSSHVAMVAGKAYGDTTDPNSTYFVILETDYLDDVREYLDETKHINYVSFYEPDYSVPRVTAICSQPISWHDFKKRSFFADFDLMNIQ